MRTRVNQAPKAATILVALVLTIFAALAFFTGFLPATIAGVATLTLGLWAAILATVLLLLGVVFRGL
jgi:hypothetical protein